ncbi:MAG TPA: S-methyl-5'-thioadenosine phosphorylase [bacterium]|jgi:5'-methylthioadenosine phosphorylase
MIGIIGGSGLYSMADLQEPRWQRVATPYGDPSDELLHGRLNGLEVVFLPRHGRNHRLLPSEINYRANIFALKSAGVRRLVSVSAVGSLREAIAPGHLVVVDQFVDHTRGRQSTFFGDGAVGHVSLANPVCADLCRHLADAVEGAGGMVHRGGTYLGMEGPQFSTQAESRLYRSWGMDVIGMTNVTEAKLAREAGLCYATLAMSTDYDCWHEEVGAVEATEVLAVLHANVALAQRVVKGLVRDSLLDRPCACAQACATALLTPRDAIPPQRLAALSILFEP